MEPFIFKCRAVNIEHSCFDNKPKEAGHPNELLKFIDTMIVSTEELLFPCIISSKANNYQIDVKLDSNWIDKIEKAGWRKININLKDLKNIPNILPDAFLNCNGVTVVIEIEKSNKKTIWFDFIKLLMLIRQNVSKFGILIVPRNYAHAKGVWDLFREARFYRRCLSEFAGVDESFLSKIAIIGYTQEACISDNMPQVDTSSKFVRLDDRVIRYIKKQAASYLVP